MCRYIMASSVFALKMTDNLCIINLSIYDTEIVIIKTYGWKWEFEANFHHELLNYWTIRENHGWIWACRVQKCPPFKN